VGKKKKPPKSNAKILGNYLSKKLFCKKKTRDLGNLLSDKPKVMKLSIEYNNMNNLKTKK
jgi:hypothetical protein